MAEKSYLLDMDGVLITGTKPIPGAQQFIQRLTAAEARYAIITNNPMHTPEDLHQRLRKMGLDVPSDNLYTSAMATAEFVKTQMPGARVFAIGENGLISALIHAGCKLTEHEPDYVVLGETASYSFEHVAKAVRLVAAGARFIATNPDPSGPTEKGLEPACGAMAALIEKASGVSPYFVGKPNPLMMRTALRFLGAHSEEAIMVGDRMDTDVVAGMESGLETILVLTGVTTEADVAKFPYRPTRVAASVAEIEVV